MRIAVGTHDYYAPPAQSRYVWLVSRAEEWSWSSVRAHLAGEDDSLVSVRPVLDRWPNFRESLLQDYDDALTSLRKAEGIGPFSGTDGVSPNASEAVFPFAGRGFA